MAISLTSLPKFIKCTAEQYAGIAQKDQNALYFLTDKNTFYIGARHYAFDFVASATDPTGTGVDGTIYYNTATGVASIWNGSAFVKLGVATDTSIPSAAMATDNGKVPTTKAVKDYADGIDSSIRSDVADNYVAKESGKSLVADTEISKLAAYPAYSSVSSDIDGKVAKITGTQGNLIKSANATGGIEDAGVAVATSVADSDAQLPTGKAVKTYTDAAEAAAKTYADGLISALGNYLTYKGTVAAVANLPSSDNKTGDVYHVTADGAEYAWNGTQWEEIGRDFSNFVQKKSTAVNGNVAGFDSNGDVVDSGKAFATTVNNNDTTVPTGAAVKTYADAAAAAAAANKLDHIANLTAANNDEIVTVSSAGAAVAASGKKIVTSIGENAADTEVATAAAVKAYADGVAQAAAGAYIPFIASATQGNIPLIGADGETLTDSTKSIVTSVTGGDNIPTDAAVKTYADGKIAKVTSPTAGDLVTVTSDGQLADAGKTASSATASFATNPSANVLPNEAGVVATIQDVVDALAWQTLS